MNLLKHYIMIFFVSMVPIVELRGAIPISQALACHCYNHILFA